jgi:hypothetical protein
VFESDDIVRNKKVRKISDGYISLL